MLSLSGCVSGGLDFLSSVKGGSFGCDRHRAAARAHARDYAFRRDDRPQRRDLCRYPEDSKDSPLPWANASTGSAGVIDTIVENNDAGQVCRQFRTTRHSYVGIAKFYGKTCLVGGGNWQLLSFQPES